MRLNNKIRSSALKALAIGLGLSAVATTASASVAVDELDVPDYLRGTQPSSLELLIDENKSFDIISAGGLNYDSGTGAVFFDVLGPLFCFQLSDNLPNPALLLSLGDANGDSIVETFPLDSTLQYRLFSNQIAMTVPDDGACFYESDLGFGIDGIEPADSAGGSDRIFTDRFVGSSELQIEFIDVPSFVRVGEFLNYSIEVRNFGTQTASKVGIQELYPRNLELYPDGQLIAGFFACVESGGANCADATSGLNSTSIRGKNVSIPPGGSVRFNISRRVFESSVVGGTIDLYAGAVERSREANRSWDAATATMTVIGEGQTIAASFENTALPVANGIDQAQIRVTALDNLKNPTPDVTIEVSDPDNLIFNQTSGVTGVDGSVVFLASTSGAEQAGSFLPEFVAPEIGTNGANTNVSVEFVADLPAQFSAFTTVNNAVADGKDVGIIEVSVFDALSNPVENALVTVQNPDGLTFVQSSGTTDQSGIAVFTASSTDSGTFSPTFAQLNIAGTTSSEISFTPGEPAQLAFVVQPSDVAAGEIITPAVVIQVLDAFGNLVVADDSSVITLQLRQNSIGQSFFPDAVAVDGVVTFSNLSVDTAGTNYDLRVFSDYPTITSDTFEVFRIFQ